MSRQNKTGNITEDWVKQKLAELGLKAYQPVPDRGIDLIVSSPKDPNKSLKIQVKGRGKMQKNRKYRWFQIRTTEKQREETLSEGLPLNEAWRKKAALVGVFIFVSGMHREFWIFEVGDIENLILICRSKYGNRKDNKNGLQAGIDLDIEHSGIPLTELFKKNLDHCGNS